MLRCAVAGLVAVVMLLGAAALPGGRPAHAAYPLRIAALGDSITFQWTIHPAYEVHVERDLGRAADSRNFGFPGRTSGGLVAALQTDADMRATVAAADIVTVEIGFNDFNYARMDYLAGACGGADGQDCLRQTVADFALNWDALLAEIDALVGDRAVAVRAQDIYYPVAAIDQQGASPPFATLNGYLTEMNAHIHASAAAADNVRVAAVHDAYNGADGAGDPIARGYIDDLVHPNGAGSIVIADLLRGLGYTPLVRLCPDVNTDRRVNVIDIMLVTKSYGVPLDAATQVYDLNASGTVNVVDAVMIIREYNTWCS